MRISVMGVGNLGSSLISGLRGSGVVAEDMMILVRDGKTASAAERFGIAATSDINEAFDFADVIFIVVKSYVFEEFLPQLKLPVASGKTVVSFMAGYPLSKLEEKLGADGVSIVHAMPSIAIAQNSGVIGYTAAPPEVAALIRSLGYALEVSSEGIGQIMAFAACGIGFAAHLIDAFAKAGERFGFSHEEAQKIAAMTFRDALSSGDFAETVGRVATKGGATEQGILHLDSSDVEGIIATAMQKAYDRMI